MIHALVIVAILVGGVLGWLRGQDQIRNKRLERAEAAKAELNKAEKQIRSRLTNSKMLSSEDLKEMDEFFRT